MAELLYSARVELPYYIERGRINLLRCPVYRSGSLAAPNSGTFTLRDPSGTEVVSAQAVTISGSIAQYSVSSLSTYAYADGWTAEWALAMGDSTTHTFRQGAALVRCAPSPVVADADLYRRVSSLNPSGAAPITTLTTFQDYIDESWTAINRMLSQAGRRPWLIIDSTELREPHLLLTLALIFEDFATRLNTAYADLAKMYRAQFREAWAAVKLAYDIGEDGVADPGKRATSGPIWLGARGQTWPAS